MKAKRKKEGPGLGERLRERRHIAELETLVGKLGAAGVPEAEALDTIARVGTVGILSAMQGRGAMFIHAMGPIGDLPNAIEHARANRVDVSEALVNPEDHAKMAEAAGHKAIIGPDGKPMGAPPVVGVGGVLLVPLPAIGRGWAVLLGALFSLRRAGVEPTPEPAAEPAAEAPKPEPEGCPCGTNGPCCEARNGVNPAHECSGEAVCEDCYTLECTNCGAHCCCEL